MKKKMMGLLMAAAMTASVVAGTSVVSAEGTEITFWSMWASSEPQGQVIQEAADAYKEATGVTVNIEWKNRDLNKIVMTALEANEPFDIFEEDYQRITGSYKDYCYDLTEMAEAANYADQSFKCFNDIAVERAGFLPCVSEQPQVGGVFYNKDIFEDCGITEVPATWDEFMAACQAMVDKGYEPMALDTAYAAFFLGHHLDRAVGQAAVSEMSMNGGWSENEAVANSIDLIIDFVNKGYLADGAPDEYPASQNKMGLTGNVAMVVCANYVCAEINGNTGSDINWGLFNYPTIENGSGSTNAYAGANSLAITSYSEHPQEAFDFLMFLTSGEFDQKMADAASQIPADPRNTAPAIMDGTVETLLATEAPLKWNMGVTDNSDLSSQINEVIINLFEGKYETGADFTAALDALY